MKHIDEIYKDWCGVHHTVNSCHPVHDSAEACDFAEYYHKQIGSFSEDDIFNFLVFYSNYDIRKLGGYMHPTMDNTADIHNEKIDKQILKEYIKTLKH